MKQNDIQMAQPITISKTPPEIIYDDLEITQGECITNSYRIAKKYPTIDIVEGLIILVDNENRAKPLPHMWNRKGNIHFDVTKEKIWTGREEQNETKDVKYFIVKFHSSNDFKNGDLLEFCAETYEDIAAINEILNKDETND